MGVWDDSSVSKFKGKHFPVLSLHERVLMVLACKYVDDVVIGAPGNITMELIRSLGISKVLSANNNEDTAGIDSLYEIPRELGIFEQFDNDSDMSIATIAERIFVNHDMYKTKFEKKKKMQDKYYKEEMTYVAEI